MQLTIATTNNDDGFSDFSQCNRFDIYQKQNGAWHIIESIVLGVGKDFSPSAYRCQLEDSIDQLNGCKILVSKKVVGLSYHILEQRNFEIFEVVAFNDSVFDEIVEELTASFDMAQPAQGIEPYSPNKDEHYYFDLIQTQKDHPQLSSKKALQSFVENQSFETLELICAHIPPWIEAMQTKRMITITETVIDATTIHAIIRKTNEN